LSIWVWGASHGASGVDSILEGCISIFIFGVDSIDWVGYLESTEQMVHVLVLKLQA
jgi:hypothetical protein